MNILAFDTAFDACSVAAGRGLRSLSPAIYSGFEPMRAGHAERLIPMIDEALTQTGLEASRLDRIAVTVGPGTFTGARIAIAAARALVLATGVPVVAVTSLELMAMNQAAKAGGADELAIAVDARRDEVYFERFDPATLASRAPAQCASFADAAAALGGRRVVLAGSGAAGVAEPARARGLAVTTVAENLLPDAFDLLFLSMELPLTRVLHPLYLRAPDAKPPPASAAIARAGA